MANGAKIPLRRRGGPRSGGEGSWIPPPPAFASLQQGPPPLGQSPWGGIKGAIDAGGLSSIVLYALFYNGGFD